MKISDLFGLKKSQHELDFVDIGWLILQKSTLMSLVIFASKRDQRFLQYQTKKGFSWANTPISG